MRSKMLAAALALIAMVPLLAAPLRATAGSGTGSGTGSGSGWQPGTFPAPPAVTAGGTVDAIGCYGTTFCLALFGTGGGPVAVYADNSGTWSDVGAVSEGSAGSGVQVQGLGGGMEPISCWAVGQCAFPAGGGVVFYSAGSLSPVETVGGFGQPSQVSCVSASFCMALVGDATSGFIYMDTGSGWSMATGDWEYTWLGDCLSTSECVAVDIFGAVTVFRGGTWSTAPFRSMAQSPIRAMACDNVTNQCSVLEMSGQLLSYDIATNTYVAVASLDPAADGMDGLACAPGTTQCVAGGFAGQAAVISGSTGRAVAIDRASIDSVACGAPGQCVALDHDGNVLTLAGGSWSSPVPLAQGVGGGTGLACGTTSLCSEFQPGGQAATLSGSTWSGWSAVDSGSSLTATACTTNVCFVGDQSGNVYEYTGGGWRGPVAVTAGQEISTIACGSASLCAATSIEGRVALWNGSAWSQPAQVETGAVALSLTCAPGICLLGDGAGRVSEWNGSAWSPAVSVSRFAVTAISCYGTNSCLAGNLDDAAYAYTGGAWSLVSSQVYPGQNGLGDWMTSAQCLSPTFCMTTDFALEGAWSEAVGQFAQSPGISNLASLACFSPDLCWGILRPQPSQVVFHGLPALQGMTASAAPATAGYGAATQLSVGGIPSGSAGTITFSAGGVQLCQVALPATSCTATASLPVGRDTVTATWSGDATYTQTQATTSLTVSPGFGGYLADGFGGVHAFGDAPAESGSAYWSGQDIARGIAADGNGTSGYVLSGYGTVAPFGGAPAVATTSSWPGWDIATGIATFSDDSGGVVLDGWGGIHPFTTAGHSSPAAVTTGYWPGWKIATAVALLPGSTSSSYSGYVLDGFGALHPFASRGTPLPAAITNTPYWPGWNIARSVALLPGATGSNPGGYVLDGWGGVHAFGDASVLANSAYWPGWDIARSVMLTPSGTGGYVLDGWGGVHPLGGAPAVSNQSYWPGWDIAKSLSG